MLSKLQVGADGLPGFEKLTTERINELNKSIRGTSTDFMRACFCDLCSKPDNLLIEIMDELLKGDFVRDYSARAGKQNALSFEFLKSMLRLKTGEQAISTYCWNSFLVNLLFLCTGELILWVTGRQTLKYWVYLLSARFELPVTQIFDEINCNLFNYSSNIVKELIYNMRPLDPTDVEEYEKMDVRNALLFKHCTAYQVSKTSSPTTFINLLSYVGCMIT